MRLLLLLALGLAVLGCGRQPSASPSQTLLRYMQALEADEPPAAYRLLDEPTRTQVPYEVFQQRWRETPAERRAQAQALRRRLGAARTTTALVALPDGMVLGLSRGPGAAASWLLTDVRPEGAKPRTPEEALRLLLAAAEQRSYAAVLRLLSPAQRQVLEEELRERIERLRAALGRRQPIEIKGDRARLQYDPRFYIDLRKEADGWWVHDLN